MPDNRDKERAFRMRGRCRTTGAEERISGGGALKWAVAPFLPRAGHNAFSRLLQPLSAEEVPLPALHSAPVCQGITFSPSTAAFPALRHSSKEHTMPTWNELHTFFQQWQTMQQPPAREKQTPESIPCPRWSVFFNTFAQALRAASASGNQVDIFGIDDTGRHEMRYSAVLAWLLNSTADHGQGRLFFNGFLEYLHKKFPEAARKLDFPGSYSVATEAAVDADKRMDILIEGQKSLIVIEVKVDAREHGNQMSGYAEWLRNQPGKSGGLIYLTRDGLTSSSQDALSLSWKDIALCLHTALKQHEKSHAGFMHSLSGNIIRQYCRRINNL